MGGAAAAAVGGEGEPWLPPAPPPPLRRHPQELGTAQRPFRPGLLLLSPLPVA